MSLAASLSVLSRSFTANRSRLVALRPRAGQKLRLEQGKGRSGNEDTLLHNLHDYHYADGKLPPLTKTQKHNLHVQQAEEERFQRLSKEMVDLHEEWAEIDAKQEALRFKETHRPVAEKRHFKKVVTMDDQKRLANNRAKRAAFFASPSSTPTL